MTQRRDANNEIYPSMVGVVTDVIGLLEQSGELGSWYTYELSDNNDVLVTSYDEAGEPDKNYRLRIEVTLS